MVRFINKLTGGEMWVDDARAEEYKAAGHKPAVSSAMAKKPAATPKEKARTTKR